MSMAQINDKLKRSLISLFIQFSVLSMPSSTWTPSITVQSCHGQVNETIEFCTV